MAVTIPPVPPQAAPVLEYRGFPPMDSEGNPVDLPIFSTTWYLFLNALIGSVGEIAANSGGGGTAAVSGSLLFNVPGTIGIRSNAAPLASFQQTEIITRLDAFVKIAPDGADIIASVFADGTLIGTVTILDGATSGTASVAAGTVNAGQLITLDITQVGTTFPGGDLSVIGRY